MLSSLWWVGVASVVERRERNGSTAQDWQRDGQDACWQDDGGRRQGTKLLFSAAVRAQQSQPALTSAVIVTQPQC